MNFFEKNRLVFWLLILLVVVNISALAGFIIFFYSKTPDSRQVPVRPSHECLKQELELDTAQTGEAEKTLAGFRRLAMPVADSIRSARLDLLDELLKERPDTVRLREIRSVILSLQMRLQDIQIEQFLALKKICTPEQATSLAGFYEKLFGCDRNCRRIGPAQGPGQDTGPGKGMQHRHRRGQK